MNLEDLQKQISKNVKGIHVSVLDKSDIASSTDHIATPLLDLNRIISGDLYKGIPNRCLLSLVGPEHCMKSSIMVLIMAEAQKKGYKPVIIDTERGCSKEFCERWGLDVSNCLYIYTPFINKIKTILAQIKDAEDEKMIIGLDSAGGLDSAKTFTDALKDDPKADQGLLQKSIRSMLKMFLNVCVMKNSVGIVTGHMYGKPGLFATEEVGGGKAMKLFPNIMIKLNKKQIKVGTEVTGTEIKAITMKNREYPPFQQAKISIDYIKGINPYAGLLEICEKAGLIRKEGNTYHYGEEKLGFYNKASEKLEKYPELLDELNVWLKSTGYSTPYSTEKSTEKSTIIPGEE